MAYVDVFGGSTVQPSDVSYNAVSLTANTSFNWPGLDTNGGTVLARLMDVTPSAAYAMTLDDATLVSPGQDVLIRNLGAFTITVKDNGGNTIGTVATGAAGYFYVKTNATAAGTWGNFTFGTGSSSADAATLAGYGLTAIGVTLNAEFPIVTTTADRAISSSDRAAAIVYTSGAGTNDVTLMVADTAGSDFFFLLKNAGSGTVNVNADGIDTVDGGSSVALAPDESAIFVADSANDAWYSVGKGRSTVFAFTQLVKDVSGNSDVTLSSTECGNKLLTFIGTLTGNINVVVTNTVSVYYLYNNTAGAFNLTVKTAAGTGVTVAQGTRKVVTCDATNVYEADDSTVGSIVFSDGTVGSPSVTFTGDTDTGLYHPAADQVGVTVAGSQVANFTASGLTLTGDLTAAGNVVLGNGNALRTTTTAGHTALLQAYDNDTGPGYITFGTLTAGNTPSFELDNTILDTAVAKGTWTASGTWTVPALTLGGTVTLNGQSFSGTCADGGTFTTIDINGGTADGVTIGGAAAAAGTFTTVTTTGGIELGHASDTTLTRVSAGVVAVEGSNILLASGLGSITQAYDADTAKTDVTQTFTTPQRGTVTTDNDLSFDLNTTNYFVCTPSGAGTLTFTNIATGQSGVIKLVNGSNYAIAAHANTKVTSTFLATVSATGTYIVHYFSDGTDVHVSTAGASA